MRHTVQRGKMIQALICKYFETAFYGTFYFTLFILKRYNTIIIKIKDHVYYSYIKDCKLFVIIYNGTMIYLCYYFWIICIANVLPYV